MDTLTFLSPNVNVQVIAPGLVLLKGALDQEKQIWLANYALSAGSRPDNGFWTLLPDGQRLLNSDAGRGRIYDAIKNFPDYHQVLSLCHEMASKAKSVDQKMPEMTPTHLLLLYYATADGMYWHSDNDKNDGDNDHPIVSITIGNSCDFGYKLLGKGEQVLRLDSGDILLWGGPNRMLPHCVHKVHMDTCPAFLPIKNARLNFTYRDAPNVLGKEKDFKYNVDTNYSPVLTYLQSVVKPSDRQE